MGLSKSKRQPPLPNEQWRTTIPKNWDERYCSNLIDEINLCGEEASRKVNCLLLGPVGVGKSTFINSVMSISKERYSDISYTADEAWGSVTKQYCSYEINGRLNYVKLWDTNGIMEANHSGFNVENIDALVEGHVKSGYDFNPAKPIHETDRCYENRPSVEDEIHCATIVIDARTIYELDSNFLTKMQTLQQKLMDKDIPRVLIITKCDRLCSDVKRKPCNIFYSPKVKMAVENASKVFKIPMSNIHPVVNYGNGPIYLKPDRSVPLLIALRQMNYSAIDHLEKTQPKGPCDSASVSDESDYND